MKKLMLLCVAMVYCTCSFAQMWDNSKPDKNVTFGVRAGLNMSNMDGEYYSGHLKSLYSFHAGVNLDNNINKSFALETGVFFTDKGCRTNYADETFHRFFFQVPVVARLKFYIDEVYNIQVRAGGFGALRVGSNYHVEYKDYDAGLIAGLGGCHKNIYLGVQYEYGFVELERWNAHTSNIAISLGYDF